MLNEGKESRKREKDKFKIEREQRERGLNV
jgi:hypothetical protein